MQTLITSTSDETLRLILQALIRFVNSNPEILSRHQLNYYSFNQVERVMNDAIVGRASLIERKLNGRVNQVFLLHVPLPDPSIPMEDLPAYSAANYPVQPDFFNNVLSVFDTGVAGNYRYTFNLEKASLAELRMSQHALFESMVSQALIPTFQMFDEMIRR